ncbi:MAG: NUDIX domain-containing protein, partial [bacterium]|nr:NUDIX domain-containing protein [bacterium]
MKNWKFFTEQLKNWYHPSNRKLPWKGIKDPYLVWVSEVFLQQTQADRVVEFFVRFTSRFPTVQSLARASFEEALPYFRGLGFYGRLRRMLETARVVVGEYGGKFPGTVEELQNLPGVGPYTARAIASFAYGQKVLAPDTNVARVLSRFWEPQLSSALEKRWAMRHIAELEKNLPDDLNLNQALMDLGASVCLAKSPDCGQCPLVKKCVYGRAPQQFEKLQNRKTSGKKFPKNFQKIVVGVLIQDKRVLVSRRKPEQTYAGLLEFPGGKVEAGEDERSALQREFREELGVEISVRPPFQKTPVRRDKNLLSFHRCRILTIKNEKL